MVDIGSLGPEILQKIFEHVRGDGFACDLLHVTQVCHLWKVRAVIGFIPLSPFSSFPLSGYFRTRILQIHFVILN
jgi:hypothetical protein